MNDVGSTVFSESCTDFIEEWKRRYGVDDTHARIVVDDAIGDTAFWVHLSTTLPSIVKAPQPGTLNQWLLRHENIGFYDRDGERFRFVKSGQKWRLIPFPRADQQVAAA